MGLARRSFLFSAIASAAAPAIVRSARADVPQARLKLHHYFSSVSAAHDKFLAPWARKVEADSGGRIRIDIFPSMQLGGAPAQLFDQACDGVADIVWAVPSQTPGRFTRIEVFELPFVPARRALVNSKALADFAALHLQDEFREVKPLCFCCRDRGVVHAKRVVQSIADLKGLKLHVPNRLAGETLRALGAEGVSVPTPQLPMALAARVIDGCLDPWDLLPGLKLHDALRAHTDFAESAPSTTTFVLAMNKAAYGRLPNDLKAVIDDNSGQFAAALAGAMWDAEAEAVAATAREHGDTVTVIPAGDVAAWRKATAPVIAAWLRQMKERRIDGGKLLAGARALLAKYAKQDCIGFPTQPCLGVFGLASFSPKTGVHFSDMMLSEPEPQPPHPPGQTLIAQPQSRQPAPPKAAAPAPIAPAGEPAPAAQTP